MKVHLSIMIIIYFFFLIAKCNPGTSRSVYSRVLIKMKVSGVYHSPTDLDPLMVELGSVFTTYPHRCFRVTVLRVKELVAFLFIIYRKLLVISDLNYFKGRYCYETISPI